MKNHLSLLPALYPKQKEILEAIRQDMMFAIKSTCIIFASLSGLQTLLQLPYYLLQQFLYQHLFQH